MVGVGLVGGIDLLDEVFWGLFLFIWAGNGLAVVNRQSQGLFLHPKKVSPHENNN